MSMILAVVGMIALAFCIGIAFIIFIAGLIDELDVVDTIYNMGRRIAKKLKRNVRK